MVAVWMKFLREWLCVVFMSGEVDLKALGEVWSGSVGGLGRAGKSKVLV
jgi:hypothetical protein